MVALKRAVLAFSVDLEKPGLEQPDRQTQLTASASGGLFGSGGATALLPSLLPLLHWVVLGDEPQEAAEHLFLSCMAIVLSPHHLLDVRREERLACPTSVPELLLASLPKDTRCRVLDQDEVPYV